MRTLIAAIVLSALAAGCAVNADRGDDESGIGEAEGALSAYGQKLVGAFETTDMASDFDKIVLRADGTYFATETRYCFTTPCEPRREEGRFIGYKPRAGAYVGALRLISKSGTTKQYRVSLGEPNQSFKLSADGKMFFAYEAIASYCQAAADCSGQSYPAVRCLGSVVCSENRCGIKCGSPEPEPTKPDCKPAGCSGQICTDKEGLVTTCEWREEYACYASAVCERGSDGTCGWRETVELTNCLEGAR